MLINLHMLRMLLKGNSCWSINPWQMLGKETHDCRSAREVSSLPPVSDACDIARKLGLFVTLEIDIRMPQVVPIWNKL